MQTGLEKIKNICFTYKKILCAFVLFVAFVVVLGFCNEVDEDDFVVDVDDTESVEDTEVVKADTEIEDFVFQENFDIDSQSEMRDLISAYYEAYASNDMDALEKVAYPISDNEKSYIAAVSKYYDKIDKFTYYSKPAAKQGDYFVSVENEILFDGLKSNAPALDFFYVETDENGKLYINNDYSYYNLKFRDNRIDSDIYDLVQDYMHQSDFIRLQREVQGKYDDALSKDKDLAGVVQKSLKDAISKWFSEVQEAVIGETEKDSDKEDKKDESKTEKDKKDKEDKNKQDESKQDEDKAEETGDDDAQATGKTSTVKTTDVVNVRRTASADSELMGQYSEGAELTKIGEEGEWTIIEFQDGKGYVKTEFLE